MVESVVDEIAGSIAHALDEKEKELALKEAELEPLRKEIIELRGMLRGRNTGSMGSGDVSDDEIVEYLVDNATSAHPLRAPVIAEAFHGDGRGFSKRLPRMVRDGLLAGNKADGYYVPQRG